MTSRSIMSDFKMPLQLSKLDASTARGSIYFQLITRYPFLFCLSRTDASTRVHSYKQSTEGSSYTYKHKKTNKQNTHMGAHTHLGKKPNQCERKVRHII